MGTTTNRNPGTDAGLSGIGVSVGQRYQLWDEGTQRIPSILLEGYTR